MQSGVRMLAARWLNDDEPIVTLEACFFLFFLLHALNSKAGLFKEHASSAWSIARARPLLWRSTFSHFDDSHMYSETLHWAHDPALPQSKKVSVTCEPYRWAVLSRRRKSSRGYPSPVFDRPSVRLSDALLASTKNTICGQHALRPERVESVMTNLRNLSNACGDSFWESRDHLAQQMHSAMVYQE